MPCENKDIGMRTSKRQPRAGLPVHVLPNGASAYFQTVHRGKTQCFRLTGSYFQTIDAYFQTARRSET